MCTVEGATLNWGYKESFRNYIESIAKGGWDLTGVVYEFPEYVWSGGTGTYDPETGSGLVAFGGMIAFSGHEGALDTQLNAARIELAGDTGYIVFDIAGTTQEGEQINQKDVRFVEYSLAGAVMLDGVLAVTGAESTLTDAGAAAFGTYAAGEAFDPVSFVIPVGPDCAVTVEEEAVDAPVAAVSAAVEPIDSSDAPVWPWFVGGAALLLLLAGGGVLMARRNSSKNEAPSESVDA
ncbi:hypothetical protein DC31_04975 [Microbacterium sp. CH12i]|uniref:HtaA domain-containing protein n=1 Tax=Microbacterium sp. CH12i TaxID=1479651 RepID=UPI000460D3D2|nr:HtaA domain-containing protein [Microbacterium sp. CH12i]KDA04663.1 hypothetical protein DC31_04975 [Microbacterium sp. CH12i]